MSPAWRRRRTPPTRASKALPSRGCGGSPGSACQRPCISHGAGRCCEWGPLPPGGIVGMAHPMAHSLGPASHAPWETSLDRQQRCKAQKLEISKALPRIAISMRWGDDATYCALPGNDSLYWACFQVSRGGQSAPLPTYLSSSQADVSPLKPLLWIGAQGMHRGPGRGR